jgi:hypothetical protein
LIRMMMPYPLAISLTTSESSHEKYFTTSLMAHYVCKVMSVV